MKYERNASAESQAFQKRVQTFLKRHSLMVVSTVDKAGIPESAVVKYFLGSDLQLYFGTPRDFRKFENITKAQDEVAVTIGFYEEQTLQYQGQAKLLENEEVPDSIKTKILSRARENASIEWDPSYAYFVIKPHWLKLTNVSLSPWEISTLDF